MKSAPGIGFFKIFRVGLKNPKTPKTHWPLQRLQQPDCARPAAALFSFCSSFLLFPSPVSSWPGSEPLRPSLVAPPPPGCCPALRSGGDTDNGVTLGNAELHMQLYYTAAQMAATIHGGWGVFTVFCLNLKTIRGGWGPLLAPAQMAATIHGGWLGLKT